MGTDNFAINPNVPQNSPLVKTAQSSPTPVVTNREDSQQRSPAVAQTNVAQKTTISSDAARLAAANSDNNNDDRSVPITNAKEAQQLIDQIKNDQAQFGAAQGNLTSNLARSLLGN